MADLALDLWIRAHDDFSKIFEKMGIQTEGLRGKIGLLAGGFGLLAGGVLAESVKQATDWQSKTQNLAANTNMTTAQLDAMRQGSLALSQQTGQDAERIAEGWMHISNHLYEGAAAFNIASAAAKNSAATGGDVAVDANILAGVLREYNVQAKDLAKNNELATHYQDVLHNAVANSNWTMKEFAEGSKRAFAQAGLYGVPIAQTAAQLAVLSEHGFPSANVAALNWAGMLRSLEFPTDKAFKGMKALSKVSGVDLPGDMQKLRKDGSFLPQYLADIERASSSAGAIKAYGSQAAALHAIMTQSSYRGVLEALVRNKDDYAKVAALTTAAQKGQHLEGMVGTNEAFAAQQKTLAGQMGNFKQTLKDTSIVIGTALIPMLTKMLTAAMPIVQHIATWISHHQKLTAQILAATAVIGTLVGALMILVPVIAAVLSPIGLIVLGIAAVVAAGYLLVTHWGEVSAFLKQVWSGIADAAGQLWGWLTGIWNGIIGDAQLLWEQLGEWLSGIWNGIVSFAVAIWTHVTDFFKGLWDAVSGVWQGFWDTIGTWLRNAWDGISGVATAVWNGVTGFLSGLWDAISGAWQAVWGTIGTVAHNVWTTISNDAQSVWNTAVALVVGLWDAVSGLWGATWDNIKINVNDKWTAITGLVHTVWDGAVGTVKALWDTVDNLWTAAWTTVKNALSGAWTKITNWASTFWDDTVLAVQLLWGAVTGLWTDTWTTVKSELGKAWTKITTWARGWWNDAVNAVKKIWDVVSDAWTGKWTTTKTDLEHKWTEIKNWVTHAWDGAVTSVKNIWHGVKAAWTTAWNDIKGVLDLTHWIETTLFNKALNWGKGLIGHLVNGIKSVAHDLYTAVRNALGPIGKLFPKSPAEEGPLSIPPDFRYIGDAMRQALPHVRAAATDLMGAAGMSGGALGLDVGASGGLAAAAASTVNHGHTVTIAPNITIQGGTFADKQGVRDLAHAVSEEIMHSVRMQGGLLPQM